VVENLAAFALQFVCADLRGNRPLFEYLESFELDCADSGSECALPELPDRFGTPQRLASRWHELAIRGVERGHSCCISRGGGRRELRIDSVNRVMSFVAWRVAQAR